MPKKRMEYAKDARESEEEDRAIKQEAEEMRREWGRHDQMRNE